MQREWCTLPVLVVNKFTNFSKNKSKGWHGHHARAISNKNQQQPLYKCIEAVITKYLFLLHYKELRQFKRRGNVNPFGEIEDSPFGEIEDPSNTLKKQDGMLD